MTTPTNWPNPERPGVPMFPEKDGKHVIDVDPEGQKSELVYYWKAKLQIWVEYDHEGPDDALEGYDLIGWSYVGPVLTPTQLTEMLAGERERCVEALQEVAEEYRKNAEEVGTVVATNSAEEKIEAVDDCWVKIRNLGDAP